jgi:hypothetical protein
MSLILSFDFTLSEAKLALVAGVASAFMDLKNNTTNLQQHLLNCKGQATPYQLISQIFKSFKAETQKSPRRQLN